jgi:hypothetical protein
MLVASSNFPAWCVNTISRAGDGAKILADVNASRLTGVVAQLGELSRHASEIFDGILGVASQSADRVSRLQSRTSQLCCDLKDVTRVNQQFPSDYFFSACGRVGDDNSHLARVQRAEHVQMSQHFSRRTR